MENTGHKMLGKKLKLRKTAAIQDKNQFCPNENPPSLVYAVIAAHPKDGLVACRATIIRFPAALPTQLS